VLGWPRGLCYTPSRHIPRRAQPLEAQQGEPQSDREAYPGMWSRRTWLVSTPLLVLALPWGAATAALRGHGGTGSSTLDPGASSVLRESIAKGVASLPGYGPPDVTYPPIFKGSWTCRRTLVSASPTGPEAVADPVIRAMATRTQGLLGQTVEFKVRFIEHDGRVVADRSFNALSQSRAEEAVLRGAQPPTASSIAEARWSVLNPNILALEFADGAVRELKCTKRSVELPDAASTTGAAVDGLVSRRANPPAPTAAVAPLLGVGYSEYYRIADSPAGGPLEAVPTLLAKRTQARFKVQQPTDGNGEAAAEGLEIEKFYPAISLSSEPAPQLTLKTRISLSRGT